MNQQQEDAFKSFLSATRSAYRAGAVSTVVGVGSGVYGFAADKPLIYTAASYVVLTGSILMGMSHYTKKSFLRQNPELKQTLEDLTR